MSERYSLDGSEVLADVGGTMVRRPVHSRNLLVVLRQEVGPEMLKAFGADLADWRVVTFGAPLFGLRFERAVVMLPTERRQEALDFTRDVVGLKLPTGVRPKIFG